MTSENSHAMQNTFSAGQYFCTTISFCSTDDIFFFSQPNIYIIIQGVSDQKGAIGLIGLKLPLRTVFYS